MKFPALSFALLFTGAAAHDSHKPNVSSKRRLTREFMHAMREPTIAAARKKGRAEKIRKLHEDLMKNSRKLANNYQNYQQNAANNNNGGNGQYQWNNNQNQQQNQNQNQYQGYMDANGYYIDGFYFPWEQAPFDMTSRAFKYSGCAAIKTYDQDRAAETGDPMVIDTYAVFRLCPADKCNDYSMTGCSKNYGEYAVEMKTYLSYILGYYDDRYDDYCGYCEPCDWEYQAESKSSINSCYAMIAQEQYMMQQQQYQELYNNNAQGNAQGNANGGNAAYQNGQGYYNYNQYYNAANGNKYNNNVNYNGNANNANANANNANGDANNANANANNGGNRNLQNYYSNNGYYGGNAANQNNQNQQQQNGGQQDYSKYQWYKQYQQNQQQMYGQNGQQYQQDGNNVNQNAQAYGYYDENGDWVDGVGGAQNQFGYWGQDGNFYPYQNQQYQDNIYTQLYKCKDGSTCDFCTSQNEQQFDYCDDYICSDYYTYCSDLYGQQQDNFDPMDFLECAEWENSYGQVYYIAPHCGSDHYTISLGVFSDENCLNYIGEDVSLATVLGFQYSDQDIFKLPKECISCDGAEEYEQQNNQGNQGRYGKYVSNPQTTNDGIVAMCSALYSGSAQCNMNMNNFEQISRYMSQYEIDQESRYCAFIENILYGAYDESGEIMLKPEQFDFADWRNPHQYKKLRMSVGQAVGLSLSIILCVALLAAAAVTNRQLTRQSTPWKPKRDSALARQNSGIVMGRSRSGPGAAPLI